MTDKTSKEKIVQVSGFGVENTEDTQTNYMVVAVTDRGRVVISCGDTRWSDISPPEITEHNPPRWDYTTDDQVAGS